MIRIANRGGSLVACLGLSAAVLLGLAAPASAEPGQNQAVGFSAAGLIVAGPLAAASSPGGPPSASVANIAVPDLLEADAITATAGPTSASAELTDVTLFFLPTDAEPFVFFLSTASVRSECSYDPTTDALTGDANFGIPGDNLGGVLNGPGEWAPAALNPSPQPNDDWIIYDGPDVADSPGTIIFNRQTTNADGSLTVDAIYAVMANGQTITAATSHCHRPAVLPPATQPATVGVTVGACTVTSLSTRPVGLAIGPAGAAQVTVTGPNGFNQVFSGAGSNGSLAAGAYSYAATANPGFALSQAPTGTFTVDSCVLASGPGSPAKALPATGADVTGLAGLGLAVLFVGLGLTRISRRPSLG